MHIARKNLDLKRIITNFRILNSRLQSVNLALFLIRDLFAMLGTQNVNVYQCQMPVGLSIGPAIRKSYINAF